jgi:hypothetical protein
MWSESASRYGLNVIPFAAALFCPLLLCLAYSMYFAHGMARHRGDS